MDHLKSRESFEQCSPQCLFTLTLLFPCHYASLIHLTPFYQWKKVEFKPDWRIFPYWFAPWEEGVLHVDAVLELLFRPRKQCEELSNTNPLCSWAMLQKIMHAASLHSPLLSRISCLLEMTHCSNLPFMSCQHVEAVWKKCVELAIWRCEGLARMHQLKCITPWKKYGWKKLAVKDTSLRVHISLAVYRSCIESMPEWTPQLLKANSSK